MGERRALRAAGHGGGAEIVHFGEASARVRLEREARAEAAAFVAAHGRNLYSDFLLRHGRRPSRKEAAAIGRLIGVRVRAADGTLQPRRSKADKAAARYAKTENDYLDQVLRLRCALANFAQIGGDPSEIIQYIDPTFDDVSLIREQLAHAAHLITRLMEGWDREQETRGGPRQI
jgi:hypothetical protein